MHKVPQKETKDSLNKIVSQRGVETTSQSSNPPLKKGNTTKNFPSTQGHTNLATVKPTANNKSKANAKPMAPGANISQPAALKGDASSSNNENSSHYSSGASTQKSDSPSVAERCKDRLTNARKQTLRKMILSDQLDMRDPQSGAEYAEDIYKTMKEQEIEYRVDASYLTKV